MRRVVLMMTAHEVKRALAKKHSNDMFFVEVKDGPTQIVQNHAKIDAIAMPLSWTRFSIIGYEIKVSRSDFLRDEKWVSYLPMCNCLYFIAPKGIIDPCEVADCCGVMTMHESGHIRTVRKAPRREIDMPVDMLLYLMFTYIGAYSGFDRNLPRQERLLPPMNTDAYRDYIADRAELRSLGHKLSKKMNQEIWETTQKLQSLQEYEGQSEKKGKELQAIYAALGIDDCWRKQLTYALNEITRLKAGTLPGGIQDAASSIQRGLNQLKSIIGETQGG